MTRTEELLALAEEAQNEEYPYNSKMDAFNRACIPETIKQLVELVRSMKTPLVYLHKLRAEEDATYTGSALEDAVKKAIAAFDRFEKGGK